MNRAPAPSRASGSGTLTFGLLSVPVKVYAGTEDVRVKRSEFTADGHKVGRKTIDRETGEEVAYQDIVKMVETPSGWVPLDDSEVEAVLGLSNGAFDVVATAPLSSLFQGRYVVNGLLQVRPLDAAAKPFALLLKGLAKTSTFALVQYCTRGVPKYGALMPNGRLYVLCFDEEIREDRPIPEPKDAPSDAEVALMVQLIEANREDAPEVPATWQQQVREYCEAKAADGDVTIPAPEPVEADASDLIDTLTAALAAQGVPA